MNGRIWGYLGLAVVTAGTAAIMPAIGESPVRVFGAVVLLVALYALVSEAGVRATLIEAGAVSTPMPQLPVGFGRALLEQMPSPLLVIDHKGKVLYANPAAFATIPRLRLGDHFANLFRAPVFVAAVTKTMMTQETHRVEFATGSGQDRHFVAQVGPIPPGSDLGTDAQAVILLEDRSDAHRVESMRSDFIANASHELRTPLASIIGYIDTLRGHARNDTAAREKFLGIMAGQAARMQRLVDDLMSLTRIELSEHKRPEDLCHPGKIASETLVALAPVAKKYGVELEAAALDTAVTIRGDRDQLNQVMTNLIDNAMKYSGKGDTVRVESVAADLRYPRMTGIAVEDTGPGIPREHLHRLTERFYRVSIAQSREKGGTGLGLAIVKHILNRHGGALEISSTLGKGSRFTIWLPVAEKVQVAGDLVNMNINN